MDLTRDELGKVKKRISEIMADIMKEQKELDGILFYVDSLSRDDMQQMSRSASSAKGKRNKTGVRPVEEEKQAYEERRAEKQETVGRLWMKIHREGVGEGSTRVWRHVARITRGIQHRFNKLVKNSLHTVHSKYFSLGVLEGVITNRWRIELGHEPKLISQVLRSRSEESMWWLAKLGSSHRHDRAYYRLQAAIGIRTIHFRSS